MLESCWKHCILDQLFFFEKDKVRISFFISEIASCFKAYMIMMGCTLVEDMKNQCICNNTDMSENSFHVLHIFQK